MTGCIPTPPTLQAVLVQELRWQQGSTGGGPGGADPAAVAAKQAYLTVQAAVAIQQLQQVGLGLPAEAGGL